MKTENGIFHSSTPFGHMPIEDAASLADSLCRLMENMPSCIVAIGKPLEPPTSAELRALEEELLECEAALTRPRREPNWWQRPILAVVRWLDNATAWWHRRRNRRR